MKNSDCKIPPFSLVYNMYISGLYGASYFVFIAKNAIYCLRDTFTVSVIFIGSIFVRYVGDSTDFEVLWLPLISSDTNSITRFIQNTKYCGSPKSIKSPEIPFDSK